MGIGGPLEANPAIALGGLAEGVSPLEMTSAYGTLASGGLRVEPTGIIRVEDAEGDIVYEPSREPERALSEAVAGEASRILHEVVTRGTGTGAEYGRWVAGKTGTTQSHRDAWFVGYTDELATAVWVGFPEGQVEMDDVYGVRVTGGTYPAAVWRSYMEAVQPPTGGLAPAGSISREGTARVRVCRDTFELATDACPDVVELSLSPRQQPTASCSEHPAAGE
jgi:penicillin-binding protein 1A